MTDKTHDIHPDDAQRLDAGFAALRDDAPVVSDALMARILADARAVGSSGTTVATVAKVSVMERIHGFFETTADMLGGWRGATAMTACAAMGISLGFYGPDSLPSDSTVGSVLQAVSTQLGSGLDYETLSVDLYGFEG